MLAWRGKVDRETHPSLFSYLWVLLFKAQGALLGIGLLWEEEEEEEEKERTQLSQNSLQIQSHHVTGI